MSKRLERIQFASDIQYAIFVQKTLLEICKINNLDGENPGQKGNFDIQKLTRIAGRTFDIENYQYHPGRNLLLCRARNGMNISAWNVDASAKQRSKILQDPNFGPIELIALNGDYVAASSGTSVNIWHLGKEESIPEFRNVPIPMREGVSNSSLRITKIIPDADNKRFIFEFHESYTDTIGGILGQFAQNETAEYNKTGHFFITLEGPEKGVKRTYGKADLENQLIGAFGSRHRFSILQKERRTQSHSVDAALFHHCQR